MVRDTIPHQLLFFMKKSKIFLFSCVAFILGVGLRSFVEIPSFRFFVILVLGLVVLIFLFKDKKLRVLGFVVIFFSLGVLRYEYDAKLQKHMRN